MWLRKRIAQEASRIYYKFDVPPKLSLSRGKTTTLMRPSRRGWSRIIDEYFNPRPEKKKYHGQQRNLIRSSLSGDDDGAHARESTARLAVR